jgi:hypothetical protein
MYLLVREVVPWIASLDREPVALKARAILLRTRLTAGDDAAWRRRCPSIEIFEIPGRHRAYLSRRKSVHYAMPSSPRHVAGAVALGPVAIWD